MLHAAGADPEVHRVDRGCAHPDKDLTGAERRRSKASSRMTSGPPYWWYWMRFIASMGDSSQNK
ncbi:hypothetical protein GCM10027612_48390 [Microbispora bryophytorum subsp. camponoti]